MEPARRPGAEGASLNLIDFKRQIAHELKSAGVIGSVKGQLRARLLSALQQGQLVKLGPAACSAPLPLKRRVLNGLLCEYLSAAPYTYSLSVFKEESGVEGTGALLAEEEALEVLKVEQGSLLHAAYTKAKHQAVGQPGSCTLLHLLEALSEGALQGRSLASATQTAADADGSPSMFPFEQRMRKVEEQHWAAARAEQLHPARGVEERMALYRQEVEEQARTEVARQVARLREVELAGVRLEEATRGRKALEGERAELDKLHHERLTKLRAREEEVGERLRRQQREVEDIAFQHRQKMLREEERLMALRAETTAQLDARREQLKNLERTGEMRERAVTARETAAEAKAAAAVEACAAAMTNARQEVEREYLEMKGVLAQQRMALEMDRARVTELRSEATTEIAAARAKEDRLRAQETARAEAEARAAAHAADAEICRLQLEKLSHELDHVRGELSRRLTAATDSADAMLHSAAGAMGMLDSEAHLSRSASATVQQARADLAISREECAQLSGRAERLEQENASLTMSLQGAQVEVRQLRAQLTQAERLLDDAIASRETSLRGLEDARFDAEQSARTVAELRAQLTRMREELLQLKTQAVAAAAAAATSSATAGVVAGAASGGGGSVFGGIGSRLRPGSGRDVGGSRHASPTRHTSGSSPIRRPLLQSNLQSIMQAPRSSSPIVTSAAGIVQGIRSPHVDRLLQLSRQDKAVATELASFRKKAAAQRESVTRDLAAAALTHTAPAPPTLTSISTTAATASVVGAAAAASEQLLVPPGWRLVQEVSQDQEQQQPPLSHQQQGLWLQHLWLQQQARIPVPHTGSFAGGGFQQQLQGAGSHAYLASLLGRAPMVATSGMPMTFNTTREGYHAEDSRIAQLPAMQSDSGAVGSSTHFQDQQYPQWQRPQAHNTTAASGRKPEAATVAQHEAGQQMAVNRQQSLPLITMRQAASTAELQQQQTAASHPSTAHYTAVHADKQQQHLDRALLRQISSNITSAPKLEQSGSSNNALVADAVLTAASQSLQRETSQSKTSTAHSHFSTKGGLDVTHMEPLHSAAVGTTAAAIAPAHASVTGAAAITPTSETFSTTTPPAAPIHATGPIMVSSFSHPAAGTADDRPHIVTAAAVESAPATLNTAAAPSATAVVAVAKAAASLTASAAMPVPAMEVPVGTLPVVVPQSAQQESGQAPSLMQVLQEQRAKLKEQMRREEEAREAMQHQAEVEAAADLQGEQVDSDIDLDNDDDDGSDIEQYARYTASTFVHAQPDSSDADSYIGPQARLAAGAARTNPQGGLAATPAADAHSPSSAGTSHSGTRGSGAAGQVAEPPVHVRQPSRSSSSPVESVGSASLEAPEAPYSPQGGRSMPMRNFSDQVDDDDDELPSDIEGYVIDTGVDVGGSSGGLSEGVSVQAGSDGSGSVF